MTRYTARMAARLAAAVAATCFAIAGIAVPMATSAAAAPVAHARITTAGVPAGCCTPSG